MTSSSVKHRGGQISKKAPPVSSSQSVELDQLLEEDTDLKSTITSEWDYKLALTIITGLAFLTRFWGIGHPNEVVFDEVHFGKV